MNAKILLYSFIVFSLSLLIVSLKISSNISGKTCMTNALQSSVNGVVVLSSMLLSASMIATLLYDQIKGKYSFNYVEKVFLAFVLCLGVIFIVLGAIIDAESKKTADCEANAKLSALIYVTGILMTLASGGYFGQYFYKQRKML